MPDTNNPVDYPVYITHVNYHNSTNLRQNPSEQSGLYKPPNAVSAAYVALSEVLIIALSFTGQNDKFSRKVGRELAIQRLEDVLLGNKFDERFIRFIRPTTPKEQELYNSKLISHIGLNKNSDTALKINELMNTMNVSEHSEKYLTDLVRSLIYNEFGSCVQLPSNIRF